MKRHIAVLLLGTAAVFPGAVFLTASPAGASGSNSCSLSGTGTITPGISNTPAKQTLKVSTSLTGYTGSDPSITSGTNKPTKSKSKTKESCSTLLGTTTSTQKSTTTWNTGAKTTSKYTLILTAGSATLSGTVTAGLFKGDSFSGTATFVPGAGQDCTTTPITSVTISGTVSLN